MSRENPPHDHALGLTVHSMPSPEAIGSESATRTRLGRWKMFIVMLICAAPVVASYFTYYVVRPDGRRNFGTLIDPQQPLPDLRGTTLQGESASLRTLKGQWLLISVAGGACDADCARYLYLQRQLRESLGKDKDRLDWVWLVQDDAAVPVALQPALKGATVLRISAADLATWLQPQAEQPLAAHLYLVDPMGNWMMRFPPQLDVQTAPKVKRDLERLLRASASWDTAGR
jgi:hypothetical protein